MARRSIKHLAKKTKETLKDEGLKSFFRKTKDFMTYHLYYKQHPGEKHFRDILFINGCAIDYCSRYRIVHKAQELESRGISCDVIVDGYLTPELVKYYRGFVIYRAPHTKKLEKFVKLAKENNKVVFYDIDDLVFDLQYTKHIDYLATLPKDELDTYNDGVRRFGKMLDLCDYGITTTSTIATEMQKHVQDVCIDKNAASLSMQKYSELAIKKVKKNPSRIIIGYSSGSLTHNDDFQMILPAIVNILKKHDNVYLKIIGALDIPEELKQFSKRVITHSFVDYKKLPSLIRSFDINLAPLQDTLFNRAKSCIKWMEAGLVGVPTIASNVGDFADSIEDGVDGVLCNNNEWEEKLEKMVLDSAYRQTIGDNAYSTVYNRFTTVKNSKPIADFITSKLKRNICFIIPSAHISGGNLVTAKHAAILKQQGYDVTLLNDNLETKEVQKLGEKGEYVSVVPLDNLEVKQNVDTFVATMWTTLDRALSHPRCSDVRYLVQSWETAFYQPDTPLITRANSTYCHKGVKYLTISKWCQKWLKDDYGQSAKYAPDGIDLSIYPFRKRSFKGKIKILIEGDSESHYKNVDEAFKIIEKLDLDKFEVSYLSYNGKPKPWYHYDHLYHQIPHEEVGKIYAKNDILIKTSLLESFSYPPLEMMATGGFVVAIKNDGNKEYLKDKENCLFYPAGNIEKAVEKINLLISDKKLRDNFEENGLKTAKARSWNNIEKEIIALYE